MQKEKEQSTDKSGRPESALLSELYPARDQWPMMTSFKTGRDKKSLGVVCCRTEGAKETAFWTQRHPALNSHVTM